MTSCVSNRYGFAPTYTTASLSLQYWVWNAWRRAMPFIHKHFIVPITKKNDLWWLMKSHFWQNLFTQFNLEDVWIMPSGASVGLYWLFARKCLASQQCTVLAMSAFLCSQISRKWNCIGVSHTIEIWVFNFIKQLVETTKILLLGFSTTLRIDKLISLSPQFSSIILIEPSFHVESNKTSLANVHET